MTTTSNVPQGWASEELYQVQLKNKCTVTKTGYFSELTKQGMVRMVKMRRLKRGGAQL